MNRFRPMLMKYDITEQQWRVLRVLIEVEDIEAAALAEAACILPPSITRILRALEARELVRTSKADADRRRLIINLAPKGNEFLKNAIPESSEIYNKIEKQIGAKNIELILDALSSMVSVLAAKQKNFII